LLKIIITRKILVIVVSLGEISGMKMINKSLALIMAMFMISPNFVYAQNYNFSQSDPQYNDYNYKTTRPMQADIQSRRIPAGTRIKLRMDTAVNTHNSKRGSSFVSTIMEDIRVNNKIILPEGTSIRGRVSKVVPNSFLSRGAELILVFDHVTTPVGKQIPLVAQVSYADNYKITQEGSISAGGGYLKAVEKSFDQGLDIAVKSSTYGIDTGMSMMNSLKSSNNSQNAWKKAGVVAFSALPVIIITPIAAVGGAAVGSTLFFSKSVISIFKKGDIVKIDPGKILEVNLIDPIDVPVN
jgi:hypothetical protein